ncbi:MAG: prepilin-type N-terminal cleavage/methylation domain-containing protein [Candidatus Omnitrophica bacterium]|nr:prepilin-type N-terminal cleavage/methylation domain-containing protein [Candidatus Omnitrophota bacterium]
MNSISQFKDLRLQPKNCSKGGFTLIELLIVIAIILILIAIALPNFLEAQIRARVVRTKGDIRTLGIAQESYYLDWKVYPSESEDNPYDRPRFEAGLYWLTTPIAYITSIPEDVFGEQGIGEGLTIYETGGVEMADSHPCGVCLATWCIFSLGPDTPTNEIVSADPTSQMPGNDNSIETYSPTNGTKSRGDIFQYGGDPFWIGVKVSNIAGIIRRNYKNNPSGYDAGLIVNGQSYLHQLPPKL